MAHYPSSQGGMRRDHFAMLRRAFTKHPASVGETYFQHLGMALKFGAKMIGAGAACMLHGLFPFLFVKTGSSCIEELHSCMIEKRSRLSNPPQSHAQRAHGFEAETMRAAE